MMNSKNLVNVYLKLSFVTLLIGLVYSKSLLSVAQVFLLGGIFLERRFYQSLLKGLRHPFYWILISLFLFHLVGLLWTSDFNYACKDIRIKLPLLVMPLIFCSFRDWLKTEKQTFFLFFGTVVFSYMLFSSLQSLFLRKTLHDVLMLSHIRLSLMIGFAFGIILHYMVIKYQGWRFVIGILLVTSLTFLYLVYLDSFTGFLSFFIVLFIMMLFYAWRLKKIYAISIGVAFVLSMLYFTAQGIVVKNKCYPATGFFEKIESRENGNPVYLNVNTPEVIQAWNERSNRKIINDRDTLFHTLLRYLASRGYPANADGVRRLSESDIHNIEKGLTNYRLAEMNVLQKKFYRFFWEWYAYLGGRQYAGHSIPQRLYLWQKGYEVFKQNWLMGVGTGDVQQVFTMLARTNQIIYADGKILRPHQQFLTIGIQLGVVGILLLAALCIVPLFLAIKEKNILFTIFALLMLVSMMYEDTLETQVGVSLFSIFTSFFLTQKMES